MTSSSFASMAQQGNRDSRGTAGRGDRGGTEWPRNVQRASNGGTLLLRRTSTTPHAPTSSQDSTFPSDPTGPTAQNSNSADDPSYARYSKEDLLDIYRTAQDSGTIRDPSDLFADNWHPGQTNGANGRGWGKVNDTRESHGPDICWDPTGSVRPISLEPMSDMEKSIFSGDVNSPLKPPPQNQSKEINGQASGVNGRKVSLSQGPANAFGLASPVSSRPGTRRRETSDGALYSPGLASPAGNGRFEGSPFFKKHSELRDGADERGDEPKNNSPFGGMMRSNTSERINGPASPWGNGASAGMSPMGNFGSFANPAIEKRPNFGNMRGESRLAHLMTKESSEDMSPKSADRASWRSRPRTDTDPFGDDSHPGSASLGGGQDAEPQAPSRTQGLDTPVRGHSSDFGMSDMPRFQDSMRGQDHHTPQAYPHAAENEALSPSDTNPYRSPPDDRDADYGNSNIDVEDVQQNSARGLGGIPEHGANSFAGLSRNFSGAPFDGSDRSQTSSAGKGFPSLGGLGGLPSLSNLGGLGGWPTGGTAVGTPDRESRPPFSSAFGSSVFGPMGELQSPSLSGQGNMFGAPSNPVGRGSKLGSLFPAAMQAQMQGAESENQSDGGDARQSNGFGAIGRNGFPRETDSPVRANRPPFEDLFLSNDMRMASFSSELPLNGTGFAPASSAQSNYQQSQGSSDSASNNQLPPAHQRTMVMPDRMRWVYLDPQGIVQGPWSGLEMHDWYKASFFTADLSVKKLEDAEFEPLGGLIRRIGNSREPFLVPQIGIPHGPNNAVSQVGTPFTSAPAAPGNSVAAQAGSVQPPFAGAFPSFGTTLTAEQQNNLERRKQEEQYLMARQREFLAQQQVSMKQMQMSGMPSALHHQSSQHSLHTQPSFGSITSPIGMPNQAPIQGVTGFFDTAPRQQGPSQTPGGMGDFFREEDLARLNLSDRQQLFGAGAGAQLQPTQAQLNAMFQQQHADIQRGEAARMEQLRQNDPMGFKARLREFEELRGQHDADEASQIGTQNEPIGPPPPQQQQEQYQDLQQDEVAESEPEIEAPEVLSLTQQVQVQIAASAKQPLPSTQDSEHGIHATSPWAQVNTSLPMPFPPPPQSSTPLPAPTAVRGISGILGPSTVSRSETPEAAAPPSLAPWAKEPTEASRGPSLKDIQEAEAKKAALDEERAAAARRVLQEAELKALANQPSVAPAPGLPMTSTWGNATSPAPAATSAWAKPAAPKAPVAATAVNSKQTLADIQREEEKRKQKLAAASASAQPVGAPSGGKRYSDLAGKPAVAPSPVVGAAWSTVGAGGRVKIPTGPAALTGTPVRAVSNATPLNAAARVARPSTGLRTGTQSGNTAATAMDEFNKWAKNALEKGLNSGIDVDDFVSNINSFPIDVNLTADAVYASTQLMDGRRFAEEYVRRRKLAEKGVVELANTGSGTGFSTAEKSSGWSEVAKKGPVKEESSTAGFKVVPNKKKGKK